MDRELNVRDPIFVGRALELDQYMSLLSELNGISRQIEKDLPNSTMPGML